MILKWPRCHAERGHPGLMSFADTLIRRIRSSKLDQTFGMDNIYQKKINVTSTKSGNRMPMDQSM